MFGRFIKAFTGADCQRGSVLFSTDAKREDAVRDAKQALGLAAEDRLKLVVAMDSSEDECDDDGDDEDDDDVEENESDASMAVDETVNGKLWFVLECIYNLKHVGPVPAYYAAIRLELRDPSTNLEL